MPTNSETAMTHPKTERTHLTLERTLSAPIGGVALLDRHRLLKQWYWTVPEADFDLRVGGRMNPSWRAQR